MDSEAAAKISQILQVTVMKICEAVVEYTEQITVQVCGYINVTSKSALLSTNTAKAMMLKYTKRSGILDIRASQNLMNPPDMALLINLPGVHPIFSAVNLKFT